MVNRHTQQNRACYMRSNECLMGALNIQGHQDYMQRILLNDKHSNKRLTHTTQLKSV